MAPNQLALTESALTAEAKNRTPHVAEVVATTALSSIAFAGY